MVVRNWVKNNGAQFLNKSSKRTTSEKAEKAESSDEE
jgi:hypothetical protein